MSGVNVSKESLGKLLSGPTTNDNDDTKRQQDLLIGDLIGIMKADRHLLLSKVIDIDRES